MIGYLEESNTFKSKKSGKQIYIKPYVTIWVHMSGKNYCIDIQLEGGRFATYRTNKKDFEKIKGKLVERK